MGTSYLLQQQQQPWSLGRLSSLPSRNLRCQVWQGPDARRCAGILTCPAIPRGTPGSAWDSRQRDAASSRDSCQKQGRFLGEIPFLGPRKLRGCACSWEEEKEEEEELRRALPLAPSLRPQALKLLRFTPPRVPGLGSLSTQRKLGGCPYHLLMQPSLGGVGSLETL